MIFHYHYIQAAFINDSLYKRNSYGRSVLFRGKYFDNGGKTYSAEKISKIMSVLNRGIIIL